MHDDIAARRLPAGPSGAGFALRGGQYLFLTFFLASLLILPVQAQMRNIVVDSPHGAPAIAQEEIINLLVTEHVVTNQLNGARAVLAADINTNGNLDIVAAGRSADTVVWWDNTDGTGTNLAVYTVDAAYPDPVTVGAADFNGDGFVDIAAGSSGHDALAWWQNGDGSGTNWTKHSVNAGLSSIYSLVPCDLNNSTYNDILTAMYSSNMVCWWQNVDGSGTNWFKRVISTSVPGAYAVCLGDITTNGVQDVVAAAYSGNDIYWFENLAGNGTVWTQRLIDGTVNQASSVATADINGDGKTDVIGCGVGNGIVAWWENTNGAGTAWVRHTIAESFNGAYSVKPADMDADGDMDITGAGRDLNRVVWWENRGGDGTNWYPHVIDSSFAGAIAVDVADLNGDTDPDVLGAAYTDRDINWWEQQPQYGMGDFHPVVTPVSTNAYPNGRNVACAVLRSPVTNGVTTQYCCNGWTGTGSVPAIGASTNTGTFGLASDSSIDWLWSTQYWMEVTSDSNGLVNIGSGWFDAGSNVTVTASPKTGYSFAGWGGDVPEMLTNNATVTLPMDYARSIIARFDIINYTITATMGANGMIAPSGVVSVAHGSTEEFEITPDAGYRIAAVLINGISNGVAAVQRFVNIRNDHTIHAIFELDTYSLYVDSAHGTTEPPAGAYAELAGGSSVVCRVLDSPVADGARRRFTCTGWSGSGSVPSSGTTNFTESFAMAADSSIAWSWATQHLVTAVADSNGSVDVESGWYNQNAVATISAQPSNGYAFSYWSGDVAASNVNQNPLNLLVSTTRHVVAHFSTYWPVITASAGSNGVISPSGAVPVALGGSQAFSMIPDAGYRVADVLVDTLSVGSVTGYTFSGVVTDHTVSVSFVPNVYTLTVASAFSTASPTSGLYVLDGGTSLVLSVDGADVPEGVSTQYVYTGWSGTGSVPVSGTATSVAVVLTNDSAVTWNWATQYWVSVSVGSNGWADAVDAWHTAPTALTITATASNGYRFGGWSGDVEGLNTNANPLMLTVTCARALSVSFNTNLVSLLATAGTNGAIVPSGLVQLLPGSDTNLLVTADPGYRIDSIMIDSNSLVLTNLHVCSVVMTNVQQDYRIDATFVEDLYSLTVETPYGIPDPPVGTNIYESGSNLVGVLTDAVITTGTTRYVFTNWSGSGSVPESGTTTNIPLFSMTNDSTLSWNWKTQFWVAVDSETNGSVSFTDDWYDLGSSLVITAAPQTNYRFAGWCGDLSSGTNDNPLTLDVTQAYAITAAFGRAVFTITTTSGANGVISPTGVVSVAYGATTNFEFTADPGYRVAWLVVDGETNAAVDSYVFSNVVADHVLEVQFENDTFALTVVGDHGTSVPAVGTNWFANGSNVACSVGGSPEINGSTQFVYTGWTGTGSVPSNGVLTNLLVTITNDSTLTWNWLAWYELQVSNGLYGSVVASNGWHAEGSNVTVTAVPSNSYRFAGWSGDVDGLNTNANPLVFAMTNARTLTALFDTNNPILVIASDYGTPTPGVGTNAGAWGRDVECSLSGSPEVLGRTQHICTGFSGTGSAPTNGTNLNLTITVTNESTLTWNWLTQYDLQLNADSNGVIEGSNGWYDAESAVTVRAVPGDLFRFDNWTGDVSTDQASRAEITLTMDQAKTLNAHFSTNYVYITASASQHGTISPTGQIQQLPHTTNTFTMAPDPHCHVAYVLVDGASIGATNSYTFADTVEDHSIHVVFEIDTVDLVVGTDFQENIPDPPSGLITYDWGSNIYCAVTNSIGTNGTTRYHCLGWTGTGSVPASGTNTYTGLFSITNDSTLRWLWGEDYWLRVDATANGDVDVNNGWYPAGSSVVVTATASNNCNFMGWVGDTNGCVINSNQIDVLMDAPRAITATFEPDPYTLTVYSLYDFVEPATGVHTYGYGSDISCSVTAEFYQGTLATQIASRSWTGTGSLPASGSGTNVSFTLTNDTTLTWLWTTNLYLATTITGSGQVSAADGWYALGGDQVVTAMPAAFFSFSAWGGDTNGCTLNSNVITAPMTLPRQLQVLFTAALAPGGTPEWWLASYGLTNDSFAIEEYKDTDGDGLSAHDEYIVKTDPTNPSSCLQLVTPPAPAGGVYTVQWPSVSNVLYNVHRATDLDAGFMMIATNLTVDVPTATYLDSNAPPVTPIFYGIGVTY